MAGLFRLLKMQYIPPTDPRGITLAGKTVLLTGATSGLGYEAAIKFLNLGVDSLVIGSRSLERGNRTKAELEKVTSRPGVVQVWELEMNNFQSIKDFANRVNKDLPRVDIALLNAGLWNREYMLSPDGYEETLQVNTLSTSLLALLLLPKLRESSGVEPTHLSVVSSQQFARVRAENLTEGPLLEHLNSQDRFQGPKQYGISKLLLEYVMKTVADLVRNKDGTLPIIVNTISPGLCQSSLTRQYRRRFYERWLSWLAYRLFARTTEQGSRSLVSATLQGVESQGKCWRSDGYLDESKALTTGHQGKEFQDKAWKEIVELLESQAAEVRDIIKALGNHV
ncbi:short-chain dehydrogenase/reductase family protein [Penicillium longicatenatum]|uniref:short-chain dehydrogenase/reductase family protein n=1 Tax=Penicillium longicatenatum TaxID=1561947 RepID=UPI00254674B5|nr:short-chain dehydrogenase/reductase family protein [Penicillium longicatenatum]KAJ5639336.1 short-chain dehydrogenase/reductase family protein [Penicillium longicatenatum]